MSTSRVIHGYELSIDPEAHAYTWNGEFVPGVTTILKVLDKPALIQWSATMASDYWHDAIKSGRTDYKEIYEEARLSHRKKKEAAADIGKNVHHYAEVFFKNELVPGDIKPLPELLTDEAKRGVEAFHDWLAKYNVKIKASERLVFSKEHFYAGTCDFVAEINGELAVGDIKTSTGIYDEAKYQTAAYQHAFQEEKKMAFGVRWITRFDKKTGKFEAKEFRDFETDFGVFKATLAVHRALQAARPPKKRKAG